MPSNETERNVLIYRQRLLPLSENFILNQTKALPRSEPYYLGIVPEAGVPLPDERVMTLTSRIRLNAPTAGVFAATGRGFWLSHFLDRARPALVHAHFLPDACQVMRMAKRISVPLVATAHGFDATITDPYLIQRSRAARYYVQHREELASNATIIIAVSNFIRRRLLDMGFPAEKLRVHYMGVDVARFGVPMPLGRRKRQVLFVGRLVGKKGCADVLEAMAIVQNADPSIDCVIVGDGALRAELETMAGTLRVSATFTGRLNHDSVIAHLRTALALVGPSQPDYNGDAEGFGTVFAEAQACGTPVIGYNHGGVVEAVEHGTTGFLHNQGDIDSLANSILLLANDSDTWHRMSASGASRVQQLFDVKKQSAILEDLYDEAIDLHHLRPRT
jgi:colanic acid/amylovoran biosynthesis glycosyltransferase